MTREKWYGNYLVVCHVKINGTAYRLPGTWYTTPVFQLLLHDTAMRSRHKPRIDEGLPGVNLHGLGPPMEAIVKPKRANTPANLCLLVFRFCFRKQHYHTVLTREQVRKQNGRQAQTSILALDHDNTPLVVLCLSEVRERGAVSHTRNTTPVSYTVLYTVVYSHTHIVY